MTISFVSSQTASGTSLTVPTTQAGDIVVMYAFRGAATGAPTLPAGWNPILSGNGTTCAARSGYRIATGSSTASGTWTNAAELICAIYRPSSGNTIFVGQAASHASTTNTVNYPALSPMGDSTSGNSWVLGFTGVRNLVETINTPPSGMSNRTSVAGATYAATLHDTNSGVSSWASTNVTTTGTATGSITHVIELVLVPKADNNNLTNYLYQAQAFAGNPSQRGLSGTAYTLPFQWTSGTGNCLVLWGTFDAGATITSVADNINGTWAAATVTASGGVGNLDSAGWVFPNTASGLITVTVTFSGAVASAQFNLFEFFGIATSSPGAGSHSVAFSTTIGAGSYTPTNNNATGGNLVLAYFCKSTTSAGSYSVRMFPGANFTFLNSNIGFGGNGNQAYQMTNATEAYVQATSAALNPAFVSAQDTGDQWNSLSLALKISSGAGTAPSASQIRPSAIDHFSTIGFPTSGNWNLQLQRWGNLQLVTCTDGNLNALTVTDSEGNTWTPDGVENAFWFLPNASTNSNLMVFITGGGGSNSLSWRSADIVNADPSPFVAALGNAQVVTGLTTFTASPAPAPSNTTGLIIANITLGTGPGLACTAGGRWVLANYSGETDSDMFENADIMAINRYTASGSQTWTFSITSQPSNQTGAGFIWFKEGVSQSPFTVPEFPNPSRVRLSRDVLELLPNSLATTLQTVQDTLMGQGWL